MRLIKLWSAVFLLVFVVAGCGDEVIETCITEGTFTGSISLGVAEGNCLSRPIYVWADGSDITATRIKVERLDNPAVVVWEVFSTMTLDDISSPADHGVLPINASQGTNDEPNLSINQWYRVTVSKLDPLRFATLDFRIDP